MRNLYNRKQFNQKKLQKQQKRKIKDQKKREILKQENSNKWFKWQIYMKINQKVVKEKKNNQEKFKRKIKKKCTFFYSKREDLNLINKTWKKIKIKFYKITKKKFPKQNKISKGKSKI
ncbi:hypothetical protein IMG5_013460 [Ichthyophthirius multifiliis]|uniref:Uncharacterized protein n=1 Tax=Ichthyophthirius multifiliis TaxID=5932 RepID=G0QK64_ICHMU|nr:hypothetical protein IMG5_013460 [Ichthyophthirius multifiliis]EGR34395.1 hypothetical protein IMG5_013460 [Ichthyophthirius multifiliis]|eukprot:XP_004039699.1 hypothetical protein IMG5_013460 [Ichthyophthirius multifiliis]